MEKSIILLLFFSFVLAITSFYLGFIEPSKNLGHAAKLFFVLVIVILIPLFAGILWFQSSAKERLMGYRNSSLSRYRGNNRYCFWYG